MAMAGGRIRVLCNLRDHRIIIGSKYRFAPIVIRGIRPEDAPFGFIVCSAVYGRLTDSNRFKGCDLCGNDIGAFRAVPLNGFRVDQAKNTEAGCEHSA